jgi:hypothetical protein
MGKLTHSWGNKEVVTVLPSEVKCRCRRRELKLKAFKSPELVHVICFKSA